ncbi:uncharacterized protein J4E87_004469 [Alternaria ethzedia]|uniref:uncharacterized protein n=1 Tax=Alternaria ethzedia TaxID=181014 RepID=UPI0020C4DCF4|nr:uncharacterized protein J4E87_004469 [Alternaria ethzedia]KAI4627127.1 hypothetical protein J4E87_004469 [Alternaria ethzedia]
MPLYPESKLLCMGTQVVSISVGKKPDHEDFTVHEWLIRESSTLIHATLLSDQSERKERTISLPDYKPKDFKIYMQWLYTERVLMESGLDDEAQMDASCQSLIKGYLLGCHLGDEMYRDTIMDFLLEWNYQICTSYRHRPIFESVKTVFDSTELGDPLRKFMVDFTVWNASHDFWVKNYEDFPDHFVAMVSIGHSFRSHYGGDPPISSVKKRPCLYHCHTDETCYTKRLDR